jgi:hypothetical protein
MHKILSIVIINRWYVLKNGKHDANKKINYYCSIYYCPGSLEHFYLVELDASNI